MLIPQPYLTQKLAQKKREKSHSIQRKVRLSENQPKKLKNAIFSQKKGRAEIRKIDCPREDLPLRGDRRRKYGCFSGKLPNGRDPPPPSLFGNNIALFFAKVCKYALTCVNVQ